MEPIDRILSNRANRRILLTGGIVLCLAAVFSGAAAYALAHFALESIISALDERGFLADSLGIAENAHALPYLTSGLRRRVFWVLFAVSGGCTLLCTFAAFRHTDRIYRDLEHIYQECLNLPAGAMYFPGQCGSASGSVRRVCEGISAVTRRTGILAQKLEKRGQIQQELVSDISHQIKTSLAVVRLNRDMLESLPLSPEDTERLTEEIRLHLDGMEALVLEALKLARLNADAVSYDFSETDLNGTIRLAAGRIRENAAARGIRIVFEGAEGVSIPHDRVWVCEAVGNIIKNAIDHAGCTEVTATVEQLPAAVRVSVRDNGAGIPLEEIPRLFDRFHSGAGDMPHSTGLGLAIARRVLRAHGAEITVYSGTNGTEFLTFFRPQGSI